VWVQTYSDHKLQKQYRNRRDLKAVAGGESMDWVRKGLLMELSCDSVMANQDRLNWLHFN